MTMSVDEFIEHHGVKGMRWGQRKSRSVTVGKSSSGSKPKVKTTTKTSFSKSPSRLSDAELNRRVKRMEVEKRYNDLNKKDVSAGKAYAASILGGAGKNIAMALLTGAALYGVGKALNAKMGPNTASAITGKKFTSNLPPPPPGTKRG